MFPLIFCILSGIAEPAFRRHARRRPSGSWMCGSEEQRALVLEPGLRETKLELEVGRSGTNSRVPRIVSAMCRTGDASAV